MKKLFFLLGVLCLLYAGLYMLGFLPVSVWQYALDLFIEREPNTYYKIVPSESSGYEAIVACLVGVLLIVISKLPIGLIMNNQVCANAKAHSPAKKRGLDAHCVRACALGVMITKINSIQRLL